MLNSAHSAALRPAPAGSGQAEGTAPKPRAFGAGYSPEASGAKKLRGMPIIPGIVVQSAATAIGNSKFRIPEQHGEGQRAGATRSTNRCPGGAAPRRRKGLRPWPHLAVRPHLRPCSNLPSAWSPLTRAEFVRKIQVLAPESHPHRYIC